MTEDDAEQPDSSLAYRLARRLGGRLYYGWVLVVVLAIAATTGYGILAYAFPVFLAPMEAELGWSRTMLTGAYSLAALVSGAAAIPVGRWVDRRGARGPMALGALAAAGLLLAWARVESVVGFYLVWIGIGAATAAVFYETAFAVVANWFERLRGRALTVLTFVGGFASIVFVPLTTWLVQTYGWRAALVWLAAILALVTIPPCAVLLRRRPEELGLEPDGGGASAAWKRSGPVVRRDGVAGRTGVPRIADAAMATDGGAPARPPAEPPSLPLREAARSRSFVAFTLAFGLSKLVTTAMSVHLIPLLLERGYGAVMAGTAMGVLGALALPGRLVFTPLGDHMPRTYVTATIFALQGLGLIALLGTGGTLGVWAFVVLFGAGFGAIAPARAALVADYYGPEHFGSINGAIATALAVTRAAAPVGASLLHVRFGGYDVVLWTLLALTALAAVAVVRAGQPAVTGEEGVARAA